MKILKTLLLPVIICSIARNNCQSMEDIKSNINVIDNNETVKKEKLNFVFEKNKSNCEKKKLKKNNEEYYKHIFDKRYNEEYYKKIWDKCLGKYIDDEEYKEVIFEIYWLGNNILDLCCDGGKFSPTFYDLISWKDKSYGKEIANGDLVKVITLSELMRYAKLFDSFSFENKSNDPLLANNNVENLNKYISENKDIDEISYLQFIHYITNNTAKLKAQILEMIYNDQLNPNTCIVLKQYPKIIHSVIDIVKYFNNIAVADFKEKYKGDLFDGSDEFPMFISHKNYFINKLYFKFKLQNNDAYIKIDYLINRFNELHNEIINKFNKTIKRIYKYEISNYLINFKFYELDSFYFFGRYDNTEFLESFTFLKEYVKNLMLSFNKLSPNNNSKLIFLDQYLQQLIMYLNQLKNCINIDMQINASKYKNNSVNVLFNIANNICFYMHIVQDIFKCFEKRSLSDELSFSSNTFFPNPYTNVINDFYKSYAKFVCRCYENDMILLDEKD